MNISRTVRTTVIMTVNRTANMTVSMTVGMTVGMTRSYAACTVLAALGTRGWEGRDRRKGAYSAAQRRGRPSLFRERRGQGIGIGPAGS